MGVVRITNVESMAVCSSVSSFEHENRWEPFLGYVYVDYKLYN